MTELTQERAAAVAMLIREIRDALEPYILKAPSEASLQNQVAGCLERWEPKRVLAPQSPPLLVVDREVRTNGGRFDIRVRYAGVTVVLELKLHSAPTPVERQAQRYALLDGVDAVGVVTTSRRLEHGLGDATSLGGKPFFVIAVRTM